MSAGIRRVAACVLLIGAGGAGAQDWAQWRGPEGNGLTSGKKLPAEWGPDKNIAWKAALPGKGWSQPIVWAERILVTTAVAGNQAKPEAGSLNPFATADGSACSGFPGLGGLGGPASPPPDRAYRWKLICLDGAAGSILWEKTACEGKPRATGNRNNTYASETPVTDGEHVIAYFGNTGLYCYDLSGNLVWSKDLGGYPMQLGWGTGSSPLLYDGRVFVPCDNDQKSFLVALDKKTGNELWRIDRDETGVTVVLRAGPKFEVLATNRLDEMFWSSAAAMNESLLLRGVDHLYCIAK